MTNVQTKTPTTLAEAKRQGWTERRPQDYEGEALSLKGHELVRNAREAISETAWGNAGRKLKKGATPHAVVAGRVGGKHKTWAVYREDQVEPKRTLKMAAPQIVPILLAVWTINRRAKRYRNAAQAQYAANRHHMATGFKERKERMYRLKEQCLEYLVKEGILQIEDYCQFDDRWAEVLKGEGFCFHRPCPAPVISQADVNKLSRIESKPQDKAEPKLKDAIHTIEQYLIDKPEVKPFQWLPALRTHTSVDSRRELDGSGQSSDQCESECEFDEEFGQDS